MNLEPPFRPTPTATDSVLQVYLLGTVEFEAALALQRRLAYQVAGERRSGALVICDHPPLITVGRQGSRSHILLEPEELRARQWRVRWVNRGGGCLVHLPGQVALYPVLALDQLGLNLPTYLDRLHQVVIAALREFHLRTSVWAGPEGVWAGSRLIAGTGVAVRDWVSYYGTVVNLHPNLELFRGVHCGGAGPMTSLERERRGPLRPSLVRQRLLEHFSSCFPFDRTTLFSDHPSLSRKAPFDAIAASS